MPRAMTINADARMTASQLRKWNAAKLHYADLNRLPYDFDLRPDYLHDYLAFTEVAGPRPWGKVARAESISGELGDTLWNLCAVAGVHVAELRGKRRSERLVNTRCAFAHLCRNEWQAIGLTDQPSFPEITRAMRSSKTSHATAFTSLQRYGERPLAQALVGQYLAWLEAGKGAA